MCSETNNFHHFMDIAEGIRLISYRNIPDLDKKFPDFFQKCNQLCAAYVYNYLLSSGCSRLVNIDTLRNELNITNNFTKFYRYMLKILNDDGLVKIEGNSLRFKSNQEIPIDIATLKNSYPMFKGTLELLEHCVNHYPVALSETVPSISVLFPEGNTSFLDKIYSQDTDKYSEMPIIQDIVIQAISKINNTTSLQILEIGGGRGLFTRQLFAHVKSTHNLKYHFTDLSKRFVIDMKHHGNEKQISNLHSFKFDVTRDPLSQNLVPYSYDIIIGQDIVHATPNLELTLKNLQMLLSKNGILCLLETTSAGRWNNLIMGVTHGWWLFNDNWRKFTPLISIDAWQSVVQLTGYTKTHTIFFDNSHSDAALILAGVG
ncbi:MAG: class I SAM-dependent methyltransferase [Legionellales bacterium]|nr:class I SAM-dependent methyltransferase [Legionellales bacterium]